MTPIEISHITTGDLLAFAAPVALLILALWLMTRDENR